MAQPLLSIRSIRYLFCVSSILLIFSCKSKKETGSPCFQPYTIGNLFKNYDSTKFVTRKIDGKTQIWDKLLNKQNEGSFYVFDKRDHLEFYAYLVDSASGYNFGITFDTAGRQINKIGGEVVQWGIKRKGEDSLNLTCLLFKINRSYGEIRLAGADFSRNIRLFEAFPSNTIGANITISRHQKETILISGIIRDDCSMIERKFVDSVKIPATMAH